MPFFVLKWLQVFMHTIQCNSQCTHAAPAERLLCIHPQRNYSAHFVTTYRTHFHQLRSSNRKANQFVSLMLTKLQLEFTLLYNILPCRYTDKCIELMMGGGEGAFSVLYRFKCNTFSPVHTPCGYTWEESEQGVPGWSLRRYTSRLRFHLYHRHRGKAFIRSLCAIFLWPFPWKPHSVTAAPNRGSCFILLLTHLRRTSSWGLR